MTMERPLVEIHISLSYRLVGLAPFDMRARS